MLHKKVSVCCLYSCISVLAPFTFLHAIPIQRQRHACQLLIVQVGKAPYEADAEENRKRASRQPR